jgi:hypothetical protein
MGKPAGFVGQIIQEGKGSQATAYRKHTGLQKFPEQL